MSNSLPFFLWRHRKRHQLFSRDWCKAWAKRIHLLGHFGSQLFITARLKSSGVQVGNLTFVAAKAKIQGCLDKLALGNETFIGEAHLAVHDMLQIGNRVCINDGAKLLTASHAVTSPSWDSISSPIVIEDYVWIATDAIILPGVTIGKGAVVGAGAVVAKNVPPDSIVVGNPGRLLQHRRSSDLDYSPVGHIALFRAWLS